MSEKEWILAAYFVVIAPALVYLARVQIRAYRSWCRYLDQLGSWNYEKCRKMMNRLRACQPAVKAARERNGAQTQWED